MRAMRFGVGMAVLVALVGLIGPSTASAASIVCPTDIGFSQPIWNNVTPNTGINGCELGSVTNDSEATVNALDSMFDITTWEEIARENVNGTSGTLSWDLTGLTYSSLMLILKGGTAAVPDDYVGYLLPIGTEEVDFISPFLNPGSGGAKEVSHFALYISTDSPDITTVPEPASLMLLGSGIVALASRARRKQSRSSTSA